MVLIYACISGKGGRKAEMRCFCLEQEVSLQKSVTLCTQRNELLKRPCSISCYSEDVKEANCNGGMMSASNVFFLGISLWQYW